MPPRRFPPGFRRKSATMCAISHHRFCIVCDFQRLRQGLKARSNTARGLPRVKCSVKSRAVGSPQHQLDHTPRRARKSRCGGPAARDFSTYQYLGQALGFVVLGPQPKCDAAAQMRRSVVRRGWHGTYSSRLVVADFLRKSDHLVRTSLRLTFGESQPLQPPTIYMYTICYRHTRLHKSATKAIAEDSTPLRKAPRKTPQMRHRCSAEASANPCGSPLPPPRGNIFSPRHCAAIK